MNAHGDYFRGHLRINFGHKPVGNNKISDWLKSPKSSLLLPLTADYPQQFSSLNALAPHFAYESSLFSSAALESFETARCKWSNAVDRDGVAWRFIALYYAAFYAGHAIIRLSGESLTWINDWTQAQKEFNLYFKTTAIPKLNLQSCYHSARLEAVGNIITVSNCALDSSSGSHKALWSTFHRLALKAYGDNTFSTSQHIQASHEYVRILGGQLNYRSKWDWPWLSPLRNEINYVLPRELWGSSSERILPSVNKIICSLLKRPTQAEIMKCAGHDSPWVRFSGSCVYMVELLINLLNRMYSSSSKASLFPPCYKTFARLLSTDK